MKKSVLFVLVFFGVLVIRRYVYVIQQRAEWPGFLSERGETLIGPFVSFSSEQQVSNQLALSGYAPWSNVYGSQKSPDTDRSTDIVLDDRICCLTNYYFMGTHGEVQLRFYRNRLGGVCQESDRIL